MNVNKIQQPGQKLARIDFAACLLGHLATFVVAIYRFRLRFAADGSHNCGKRQTKTRRCALRLAVISSLLVPYTAHADSVARQWNEVLLDSIRIDFPAPTVHSRNLYHTSAAMYDAWATFDDTSVGSFFLEKHLTGDVNQARNEAMSYAAYRVLSQRYSLAVDPVTSQGYFDSLMDNLGYDKNITTTVGNTPAAIGNRIAQTILDATLHDGSNEAQGYIDNTGYVPTNAPMIVDHPSVTGPFGPPLSDLNRWQPLFVDTAFTQNGLVGSDLQEYIGPHWGNVETFAMGKRGNPGPNSWSEVDPGAPPQFGTAEFRDNALLLIRYSSDLDPSQHNGAQLINISPNTAGNRPLGTHTDQGYAVNPATNQPYADNFVKQADYGRVLAEFWADGPESETPPGHWNVIANTVSDHPSLVKQIGGTGPVVDDLEWDTKLYFALNGAVHDAAVAAWGTKRVYDYSRPISMIRYMGSLGQSSDAGAESYDPNGLPLEDGLVELITAESIAPGGKHRNVYVNANRNKNGNFVEYYDEQELVGKLAIFAWNHEPDDPETQVSGCDWILAENWVPYQQDNFVTPAFAAYVSGHSTFSRAAAEVMSLFTDDEYFPGGLGEMTFTQEDFLDFELGPEETVILQWATYYDAADEAGISRLHGGIHVPPDDFAGRIMGSEIGIEAYMHATRYFQADLLDACDFDGDGSLGVGDIDMLLVEVEAGTHNVAFDVNGDALVDVADVVFFVEDESKLHTYIGDTNLDGEFNSNDLIALFAVNEYEDGITGNSTWSTGDFNGDAEFSSNDLILAFARGGYELGPRVNPQEVAVPESNALMLWSPVLFGTVLQVRRKPKAN